MSYTIAEDPYFLEAAKTRTPDELEAAVLLLEFHSHSRPAVRPRRGRTTTNEANTYGAPETNTKLDEHDSRLGSGCRLHAGQRAINIEYEQRREDTADMQGPSTRGARNGLVKPEVVDFPSGAGHRPSAQAHSNQPSEARTEAKEMPRRSARLEARANLTNQARSNGNSPSDIATQTRAGQKRKRATPAGDAQAKRPKAASASEMNSVRASEGEDALPTRTKRRRRTPRKGAKGASHKRR